jgi:hypothetical protein
MNGTLSFATLNAIRTGFQAEYDAVYGSGAFALLPPGWFMALIQSLISMLTGGCIPPTPVPTPASLKALLADPQYDWFVTFNLSLALDRAGGRKAQAYTLRFHTTLKAAGAKADDAVVADVYSAAQSA